MAISAAKAKIMALQTSLGVKPDGIMGPKTRAAAKLAKVALPAPASLPTALKPKPKSSAITPKSAALKPKSAALKPKSAAAAKPSAAIEKSLSSGVPPSPADILDAVSTISPAARQVAASQLSALASPTASPVSAGDYEALISGLASSIAPQLNLISDALATRTITTEATSESNRLLTEAERWAKTASVQAEILEAIRGLAVQVIAKDKLSKRLYTAFGVPMS